MTFTKNPVIVGVLFFLSCVVLIFTSWQETNTIIIRQTRIDTGFKSRFILISDLHLGWNKTANYYQGMVRLINNSDNIDFVLIAGDFVGETVTAKTNLTELLQPLAEIHAPKYAVLGNHDYGIPGIDVSAELTSILPQDGIKLITSQVVDVKGIKIAGIDDYVYDPTAGSLLSFLQPKPDIVVTHNPDMILNFPYPVALTVSGHTHCFQTGLVGNFIYRSLRLGKSGYYNGLYQTDRGKIYVSCGLGETGIPFRVFNNPAIDIIQTY